MIKPKALRAGDTVAAVSLSSGMAGDAPFERRFWRGVSRIESELKLRVKVMPNALKGSEYLYNNPAARADDWMAALEDPDVSGIFCAIGGEESVRLLRYVDFGLIARNPKVFLGYSDSTACHFMNYRAGVASYHGPAILVEFAENVAMHDYTLRYLNQTLFDPPKTLTIAPSPVWTSQYLEWSDPSNDDVARALKPDEHGGFMLLQGEGVARGELLGGNLGVMQMLVGTEAWPKPEEWADKILFFETAEDMPPPESLRYFLRNLGAQGILNVISGIVVGKPYHEHNFSEYQQNIKTVVSDEMGLTSLPVLYNVNCSHTAPVCVMPLGIMAEIDCAKASLRLLEPATTPAAE